MGRTKELHLTSNKLLHIHPKAFSGLVNLKYLFLSDNFLRDLHPDTFKTLRQLEYVSLAGNPSASCPASLDLCSSQNITKLPCCTEKVGNVEEFEAMKKKWEDDRLKFEEAQKLAQNASGNASESNSTEGEKKKDGWFW
jgi:Leucine-rich repeat (LRR) protein